MKKQFDLQNKIAPVTGGSRGIGEMSATGVVDNGAKTYISFRKADACDATAEGLSAPGECISIPADLSSMQGVQYLGACVSKSWISSSTTGARPGLSRWRVFLRVARTRSRRSISNYRYFWRKHCCHCLSKRRVTTIRRGSSTSVRSMVRT